MDFFRARASAALVATALLAPLPALADCGALAGVYRDESVEKAEGSSRTLAELAPDKVRSRLYRTERPAPNAGFGSTQLRARPKVTRLAATVRVTSDAAGLKLAYLDAEGKVLGEGLASASPAKWKCVSGHLERQFETMGGLGESVRTERTRQVLSRSAEGDLVLSETLTTVTPPGAAPRQSQFHFKKQ